MAKNPANDNGLKNNVRETIQAWYRLEYEINKFRKKQKRQSEEIKLELESARKAGYTESEIRELIGEIAMPF